MARINHAVVQYTAPASAPVGHPQENFPLIPLHEFPQDPLPAAPLIEELIPHIPNLPEAVNINLLGPAAPNNGLLLLPQAPAPLSGSLFGLQGLQDAQEL